LPSTTLVGCSGAVVVSSDMGMDVFVVG